MIPQNMTMSEWRQSIKRVQTIREELSFRRMLDAIMERHAKEHRENPGPSDLKDLIAEMETALKSPSIFLMHHDVADLADLHREYIIRAGRKFAEIDAA